MNRYVSQEPSLFPGTIFDNIAAGKNGTATYEEVEQAALDASAHDFIMDLPERYNTFYSGLYNTSMSIYIASLSHI